MTRVDPKVEGKLKKAVLDGKNQVQAARILNRQGFRTSNGKRFTKNSVNYYARIFGIKWSNQGDIDARPEEKVVDKVEVESPVEVAEKEEATTEEEEDLPALDVDWDLLSKYIIGEHKGRKHPAIGNFMLGLDSVALSLFFVLKAVLMPAMVAVSTYAFLQSGWEGAWALIALTAVYQVAIIKYREIEK